MVSSTTEDVPPPDPPPAAGPPQSSSWVSNQTLPSLLISSPCLLLPNLYLSVDHGRLILECRGGDPRTDGLLWDLRQHNLLPHWSSPSVDGRCRRGDQRVEWCGIAAATPGRPRRRLLPGSLPDHPHLFLPLFTGQSSSFFHPLFSYFFFSLIAGMTTVLGTKS